MQTPTRITLASLTVITAITAIGFVPASTEAAEYDWSSWRRSTDSDDDDDDDNDYSSYRMSSSLRRKISALDDDRVDDLRIPILLGVSLNQLADTWGDARSNGRTHEGIDIFAPRGAFVVSPTDAVVTNIGEGENGGLYVYTTNPGGERLYFAHLDDYADDLSVGDVLEPGDLIGFVGNTGNASGGATHLHLGIYDGGAQNPFPRLEDEFTLEERMDALDRIIKAEDDSDDEEEMAIALLTQYSSLFGQATVAGVDLPDAVAEVIEERAEAAAAAVPAIPTSSGSVGVSGSRDLTVGSRGDDVIRLQAHLIAQAKGPSAINLAAAGATGYFGTVTQSALAEYQASVGLAPAAGYYGPLTRAHLSALGAL